MNFLSLIKIWETGLGISFIINLGFEGRKMSIKMSN